MMALTIFTIGHSNHAAESFLVLLGQHGIGLLVDVRSRPASRFAPQFNRTTLPALLAQKGIAYRWLGERLGGRPRDASLYDDKGHADYAKIAQSPEFRDGIEALIACAETAPTAIMCAERDPQNCHRAHLIAPVLLSRQADVQHILADGALLAHSALQCSAMPQLDLFGAAF